MNTNFEAMRIAAGGSTITAPSGSSSAASAIPNNAAGVIPQYVRVQVDGFASIRFGNNSVSATANDTRLNANNYAVFEVRGYTHFAVFGVGAARDVNVAPIEA